MSLEQTEELRRQIKEILDGMKKRDDEHAQIMVKLQKDVTENGKVADGTKDAVAEVTKTGQGLQLRLQDVEQKVAKLVDDVVESKTKSRILTPGEQFIATPELKGIADTIKTKGAWRGSHTVNVKTITSISGSAGQGIFSERLQGVIEEPNRAFTVRALLDQGRTASNLIEWIRELLFTNNADMVSEGTLKPESNITYQRQDVAVRTIAHWIRASKQVLADFPQLQSLINGRLAYGLRLKEEDQLLYGDGTAENLDGLIPNATAYNTALNTANDTMIDVIRHAILQVRVSQYPATGIVMSPTDWHYLELTKDNENRYLMASPTSRLPPFLWGLPVAEADAMSKGDFLVGSFRLAATLFDREQASITVSTEDQDNFVKNLVTILCEERLALAILRPLAFVFGAFPAGSTT